MPVTLKSRLPEIVAILPERMDKATLAVAEVVAEDAKGRVPVAGGTLRDSIEARSHANGAAVFAIFYWFFQEFGTVNQPAHPFIIPAAEVARAAVSQIVKPFLAEL